MSNRDNGRVVVRMAKLSIIFDHFRYTESLSGVELWERFSDWVWKNDNKGIPGGIQKEAAYLQQTLAESTEIEVVDVGVLLKKDGKII